MVPLGRSSRTALAIGAFAAFVAAYVTTPITARGAGAPPMTIAPLSRPARTPVAIAVEMPRRNPFAGEPATRLHPAALGETARVTDVRAVPAPAFLGADPAGPAPRSLPALPPNAGAAAQPPFVSLPPLAPALSQPSLRVTAVATGPHPYALIDDADGTRLVTVGDRAGGDTVVAITARGLRLATGRDVPLLSTPSDSRGR